MLPVSGAEQLSASGAIHGLRPVISASGAYCRLVSPAPYSCVAGRNRFHSPRDAGLRLELLDDRRRVPPVLRGLDLLAEHAARPDTRTRP